MNNLALHCQMCRDVYTLDGRIIKEDQAREEEIAYTSANCSSICAVNYVLNYTEIRGLDKIVKEFGDMFITLRQNSFRERMRRLQ